jgi:predicted dinucleotide-binding enzyme
MSPRTRRAENGQAAVRADIVVFSVSVHDISETSEALSDRLGDE